MYPTWVWVGAGAEAPCLPVSPQRQRCDTQGSFVSRVDGLDTQAQLNSGSEWRKTSLLSPRVVPQGNRGPTVLLSLPPLTPGSQECGLAEEELEGLQKLSVGSGCKYGVWPLEFPPCSSLLSIPLLGSIWATCPVCRGACRHSEGLERVASWFESWLQCS